MMMYVLVLVHLMWNHWSVRGADDTDCGRIRCYNNGTATRLDERCVCSCTLGYAGILCEYEMLASRWPSGPYALMKPTTGCPESEMHGWSPGSIQFSTLDHMEIWREYTVNDTIQRDLLMESDTLLAGLFGNYSFQLNFCFKRADWLTHDGVSWLPGDSVFGVAEGCPSGMIEETPTLVLPKLRFWRSDGYLPYFEVQSKAKDSSFVLKNCRYTETPSEAIIQRHKPFISVKMYEQLCHSAMEGFTVNEETLLFHDAASGDVDVGQATAAKLSVCVYLPQEKHLLKDSVWPNGPYALLMHDGGCPESHDRGWNQGYISFETHDPVMHQYYVTESGDTEVPGNNTFRIYFCYKYGQQQSDGYETQWPPGAHGVLSADQGCPQGFFAEEMVIPLPPILSWTHSGWLPQFMVAANESVLYLTVCRRYDVFSGFTAEWKSPFILIKNRAAANQCSLRHDDFSVAEETITIATTQPYDAEQTFNVTISACVYETREDFGCASDEFRCDDGKCIKKYHVCPDDDYQYCKDFSNLPRAGRCQEKCYENEFFCDIQQCIPRQWLCDGFAQCESGTDELEANCNFTARTGCFEREFRCVSGACVPPEWMCDSVKDCEDGEDERVENCDAACPLEAMGTCINFVGQRTCVQHASVCDNNAYCTDGRDEEPAICHLQCLSDEVFVGPDVKEKCLWKEEHCNDYSDCRNIGVQQRWDCGKDELACDVDRCIREEDICDGTAHCQDQADEDCDIFVPSTASCTHDLGLASGFIQDDQISATSSKAGHSPAAVRPSLTSWCPTSQDENQYLQIDLRSVSIVSGVTLYNWMLTTERIEHNLFVRELVPMGCRAFSVSHAIAAHSFLKYSDKTFEIDTSEATDIPQSVSLLRPFLARYVRIHPVEAIGDGRLCLRLELHGCLGTDTFLDLASYRRVEETSIDVLGYEIITSPNFPAPYRDNGVFKWTITALKDGFVRLTFALIDLYGPTSFVTSDCPGDKLNFDVDALGPVTATLNGLTPTYPTDQTTAVVTFTTCDRIDQVGNDRKGFRIILKNEDVPTIWSHIKDTRLLDGHVITPSLLGIIYDLPSKLIWEINTVMNGGPFTLTFWYFNVPCKLGFEFKMGSPVYIGSTMASYCNEETKPAKEVAGWWINLEFEYTEDLTIHQPEGFRASFRVNPVARGHSQLISNETILPPTSPDNPGFHKVCSDVLKKCYHYSYRYNIHDWTTQARYCRQLGYQLPVLHNKREMHFLRSWLVERIYELHVSGDRRFYMNFYKTIYYTNTDKKIYFIPRDPKVTFYIGLARDSQAHRTQLWQDGTEVTFTAWGPGEPRDLPTRLCTYMVVDMATYESIWKTRACDLIPEYDITAFVSLCETAFDTLDKDPVLPQNSNASVPPIQESRLFQCNSTEWLFFLAVCDGVSDCGDGSDEWGCDPPKFSDGCLDNEFKCTNGECVYIGQVCDYSNDCGDYSDEYCVYPGCREGEFRCTNGDCVSNYVTCDAVVDCRDGSDETDCKTCNSSTAFSCGELTCIHVSLVCDGIGDCTGNLDEQNCDEHVFYPCNYYWEGGYDHDITFPDALRGMNATCNFERIAPGKVRSTTRLQPLSYFIQSSSTREVVQFSMYHDGGFCKMEITETCPTYSEEVAAVDDPYYNGTYSFCSPRTVTLFVNYGYSGWGNCYNVTETRSNPGGATVYLVGMPWDFFCHDFRVARYYDGSNVTAAINTTVNPSVCIGDYEYEGINCGDGTMAKSDSRCLFETNSAGAIDGCRNFFHVQDCETFECPSDYMKCPDTFCVPVRSICDGVIQCPGGEDETGCRCSSGNLSILAVFDDDADRDVLDNVYEFVRNFRSPEVNVYAVNLKVTSDGMTIKTRFIHPYNDILNIDPETEFTTDKGVLASSLVNRTAPAETLHVVTVAQNQQQRAFLTDQLLLSPAVAHIYHVGVAPMIQQHVTVSKTGMRTDVTFDSWLRFGRSGDVLFPEVCENRTLSHCQDRFRCSSSLVCLPWEQVCDGVRHCRHDDDEAMCDFRCLKTCACQQYVADCQHSDLTELHLRNLSTTTRVLDLSFTDIFTHGNFSVPKPMPYLVRLFVKQCGIVSIERYTFVNTPNLHHLDLSFNRIQVIGRYAFSGLRSLRTLELHGNIHMARIEPYAFIMMSGITKLSITQTRIVEILPNTFAGLDLKLLDISNNKIQTLYAYAFNNMSAVEINFEGNDIQDIDSETFAGVLRLEKIRAPSYAFCCYKPNAISEENCWPQKDEFSSCEDLMRNSVLQTLLWVIGASAIIGNACTIGYRMIYNKKLIKRGYGMFVTNLAAADGFMGIYLLIIAVADLLYRDRYMAMDVFWRNSGWCTVAGTLATVASEASVFLMCLITMDRILVIKYPFGQLRFEKNSSRISAAVSWLLAIIIAVVPFCFPDYFEGRFYSTSGVCLSLPLTRRRPAGWAYSFVIYVALNFVAFILIAIGQLVIYLEIRKASQLMKGARSHRRNDIAVTRNLLLVLSTDFLCWFPIGVMAIMAYNGHVISGDVYAWTVVLVLPINSALNPYMYTLSAVLGRKKSVVEKAKNNFLLARNQAVGVERTPRYQTMLTFEPRKDGVFTPRDAMSASLAAIGCIRAMHYSGLVYGHIRVDTLKDGKIRMSFPTPSKPKMNDDKTADIGEFGNAVQDLLKAMKI